MNRHPKRLRSNSGVRALFTPGDPIGETQRLPEIMELWWQGRSLANIAARFGVSRQRVQAILRRVACDANALPAREDRRPDSGRKPLPGRVSNAKEILAHELVYRLTPRQLAAVAWASRGLSLIDIGARMRVAPQRAHLMLVSARHRITRESRRRGCADIPSAIATSGAVPPREDIAIDWGPLLDEINRTVNNPEAHPAVNR